MIGENQELVIDEPVEFEIILEEFIEYTPI